MDSKNTITIILDDTILTEEADTMIKVMLSALNENQIKKVKDCTYKTTIMEIEGVYNNDKN